MKASELKKGRVIQVDGRNVIVRDVQVQTASSQAHPRWRVTLEYRRWSLA